MPSKLTTESLFERRNSPISFCRVYSATRVPRIMVRDNPRMIRCLVWVEYLNQKTVINVMQLDRTISWQDFLRFRTIGIRFLKAPQLSFGRIISLTGGNTGKFIRFDYVCGQAPAIDASCIEANRPVCAPRVGRRPMTKQHDLFSAVDVVPRRTFSL